MKAAVVGVLKVLRVRGVLMVPALFVLSVPVLGQSRELALTRNSVQPTGAVAPGGR